MFSSHGQLNTGNQSQSHRVIEPVDKWIDELPEEETRHLQERNAHLSALDVTQRWLVNQNLPRINILSFDGKPIKWIDFITQFKEMVHMQPFISSAQRMALLLQHLEGEARRSVLGFGTDWRGYTRALRRLKYMFGQRASVAQAHLTIVTHGGKIKDEIEDLTNFYFRLSNCLSTLGRIGYYADLRSTDVLRNVILRLPERLQQSWCRQSYKIRFREEPNLTHLEKWLEEKVMMAKDPYMPQNKSSKPSKESVEKKKVLSTTVEGNITDRRDKEENNEKRENVKRAKFECNLCKGKHWLHKCETYLKLSTDDRFKKVKELKLCINCLRANHVSSKCSSKFRCFISGCEMAHHTTLHRENSTKKDGEEKKITFTKAKGTRVYMKVVPVKVTNADGESMLTHALLDDGSEATFIRKDLADKLQLNGDERKMTISTITNEKRHVTTKNVAFSMTGVHKDAAEYLVHDALVLPPDLFSVKAQHLPPDFMQDERYKHLHEFGFKDISEDEIQLLIGADNYHTLMILNIVGTPETSLIAAKTPLGWTLLGKEETVEDVATMSNPTKVNHLRITSEPEDSLTELITQFWSTESFGTQFNVPKPTSLEDIRMQKRMDDETFLKDSHYVVPMLWNEQVKSLPNNLHIAKKRFAHLWNRFKVKPSLHEMYKNVVDDYVFKGYAREMSEEEVRHPNPMTWYMPHHPVWNPNKPGKIRVVFDLSSKSKKVSLNDCLHTGPDLVNNLVGVLLRFRNFPIVVVGDIEAMYHQVHVTKDDSNSLRFLWNSDLSDPSKLCVFQMTRHVFGAKDSPACASYALRRTAKDNTEFYTNAAIHTIEKNMYMDDWLTSFQDESTSVNCVKEVGEILERGGFKITKFYSNSSTVMQSIPSNLRAPNTDKKVELDKSTVERALGVKWNVKEDVFVFTTVTDPPVATKRGVLQRMSLIFDPMGFIAPFIVTAKLVLQELWKRNAGWDEELDAEIGERWMAWVRESQQLTAIRIPRCYTHCATDMSCRREVHIFADASEQAFGAVAYMRIVSPTGEVSCRLLMSKSRVAPLKTLTIPRLELQAAILAVRLKTFVVPEVEVPIERVYLWTDSIIVLQYINNSSRRFKVFVANRLAEIREYTEPEQWRYVPGESNPADELTRGAQVSQLTEEMRWVRGPDFLYEKEECWPNKPDLANKSKDYDPEVKMVAAVKVENSFIEEAKRVSSWEKVIRIYAYVLRFASNCQMKGKVTGFLTVDELYKAEKLILRLVQGQHFYEEISRLEAKYPIQKKSPILCLQPFLDPEDKLLKVQGRLKHASISYAAKHPIILTYKDTLVERLVVAEHRKNIDCGPESLISHLRERYWIVGCRKLVKRILRRCLECRKRYSSPKVPIMADLPPPRVTMHAPTFFNTGVDFFGPLLTTIGRRSEKRWVCVFTCMATRAIHLELAESLNTDGFINCLERFINRRGYPDQILSDCGTNFKGADRELRECLKELDQDKIGTVAARKGIKWKFNPPDAAHMGGSWESMVKAVKGNLKVVVKNASLSDLQLYTVFCEIECLVNSRPLTAVSDDVNDFEALTPNHFLIGRGCPNLQPGYIYEQDINSRKRWRRIQLLTNQWWKRWRSDYLPTLTVRRKWNTEQRNMMVGDLVLVVEKDTSRGCWPLARVVETYPGDDGRTRVVKIKTASGELIRPVSKLCMLGS